MKWSSHVVGSVQMQVVSRGSNNIIVLQGKNTQEILQVRVRLLHSMLNLWKRSSDGWIVESVKSQQAVDELIQRLQQVGELGESPSTSEFVNYVEELLDINKQLSDMFEKYIFCWKTAIP